MTNDRRDRTVSPGRHIHWFNPENDLALASGLTNYTPPKAACIIGQAGSALPLWYGGDGDVVICDVSDNWADRITKNFGLHTEVSGIGQVDTSMRPKPWGWSAYTRRYFEKLGFDGCLLPSFDQIGNMRMLSHRRTAAKIATELQNMLPDIRLAEPAVECFNEQDLLAFLTSHPYSYLKSPWSSSGRGVICTSSLPVERVLRFAADSILHQGSVMVEQAYRKSIDFAMLFECEDGSTRVAGTSVFLTNENGVYTGNLLAPEDQRLAIVESHIDGSVLRRVRECLISIINQLIAPYYTGVLGVDMLVDSDGMLDATVELNLRTTMGYVANRFADRHLHPYAHGVLRSCPVISADDTHEDYTTEDGKITNGTILLSPPASRFAFFAQCAMISDDQ